jgi:N-formylmaleamate deformylase
MKRLSSIIALVAVLVPFLSMAAPAPSRVVENPVLRVEVSGKGRPLLFLPGLTCGGDVWNDAVAHYAARYECHVVTLGGFSGKPRFEGPFMDTARESLLAYVKTARLAKPVIVGHSLGGVLAMEMAIAQPDAVGKLVIVDALPFLGGAGDTAATEASARQSMEPMRQMVRGQTQEAYAAFQRQAPWLRGMVAPGANYERVVKWAETSDHTSVADAMYDCGTRDLRGKIAAIQSPMLVLGSWYGYKDFSTKAAVEATFRRQFAKAPRWTLALADTARHFVMLDSPEWTWSQMDAFLTDTKTTSQVER